jgi:acetyl esterase/lipase
VRFVPIAAGLVFASVAVSPTASARSVRFTDRAMATSATRNIAYADAPDLLTGKLVPNRLDLIRPRARSQNRPALVLIHGGGFRAGSKDSEHIQRAATEWAQRGYVTAVIDYRLDPDSKCVEVLQGHVAAEHIDVEWARCFDAALAARHDAQAAVRFLRANASRFGLDPERIGALGFSAGAITVTGLAYESEDPGDLGDHLGESSRIAFGLAVSGCSWAPSAIGPGDAAVSFVTSELDRLISLDCVESTAAAAEAAGDAVQRVYMPGDTGHADDLYRAYQPRIDAAWLDFIKRTAA